MVILPVWLLLSVPVIVALPTPPTIVAMLLEGWLMTDGLFELNEVELVTSVPFKVALKVMVVLPPKVAKLIGDEGLDVILSVCCVCPTVTASVPLTVPLVAVMVTPVVPVVAIPFTNPVELTLTWVASELLQVAELVTFFVLPSSLLPVAVNCRVPPTCKLGLAGLMVILVSVGFTKNPRQPTQARLIRQRKPLSNNHLRFGLNIA
jgi:hypothetical protein